MSKESSKNMKFLYGGGEMGELTRDKDWSQTSLGAPDNWPQSLRTTISIVLNSKFPMFLWWGPELICFYNDAYRPSLGKDGKHPSILGMTAPKAWPEIWPFIEPLINQVLSDGEATWNEDQLLPIFRNGQMEDVYWTFSYSPVKNEEGKVEGVLVTCSETTGKINAYKKLEESSARFLNNILQAPVAMCILRGSHHVVEVTNDLMLELWGKKREEVINKPIFDGLPEARGQGLEILMNHVFTTGEKFTAIERPVDLPRNGKIETTYINFVYDALREPDGSISGIMAIASDVTQQVMARKKIEESEERFRTLADNMSQLAWMADEHGSIYWYNKRWFDYTGTTFDEMKGWGWLKVQHPDHVDRVSAKIQKAWDSGEDWEDTFPLLSKEGKYHWFLSRALPIYNEEGKIKLWFGTNTDITLQKKAEEKIQSFAVQLEKEVKQRTKELNRSLKSLKKSETRYHLMVEEVQDYAILYLNKNGIIENWNKGAEKIKGYSDEEIIGKSFTIFYTDEDRNQNLPQQLLARAATTGKAVQEGWRVRKDGSLFWASVVITAVHEDSGKLIGFSKMTRDLTERKDAEDQLKANAKLLAKKNTELEAMNKELQSFAYVSSHDLQEPLRKIQTFSTRILEKEYENLSENGKDNFMRMQRAAKRMRTLIDDLLAYSRTNPTDRNFEKTDLNEVVDDVKEEIKDELDQLNATLEIGELCEATIIPFQIRQLMLNLLGNSLKFAHPDLPPHIKITSRVAKGRALKYDRLEANLEYCHITVEDNGIGFEPEYREKIFNVFQRLHGKNEYKGTGIGLAIVKKIVDNHNGFITAFGEKGMGAKFEIYLPLEPYK